ICSDIYGPFKATEYMHNFQSEKLYIITFTDRASRFTQISFTDQNNSEEIAKIFKNEWLRKHQKPQSILTDNGTCYLGPEFQNLLKKYQIRHKTTSVYNPTGNGIAERQNQTLSAILRIYKGWDLKLVKEIIEIRFNELYQTTINDIPLQAYKKNKINVKQKICSKTKKRTPHKYKEEEILIKNFKRTSKTDPLYIGPYVIKEVSPDNQRVRLSDKTTYVWHNLKNIKPYRRPL
ncbi:putative LTR transposable element, partial [Pseudoloma neurophilia]